MAPTATMSACEMIPPPGLETVRGAGCDLTPGGVSEPDSPLFPSMPSIDREDFGADEDEDERSCLVREVANAVQHHVDEKTTAAVEMLWQKGQRAIRNLQKEQAAHTELLQGQLRACAEAYRTLERDNAMLRQTVENIMKHLSVVMGPPPCMIPCPPVPPVPFGGFPSSRPSSTTQATPPGSFFPRSQKASPFQSTPRMDPCPELPEENEAEDPPAAVSSPMSKGSDGASSREATTTTQSPSTPAEEAAARNHSDCADSSPGSMTVSPAKVPEVPTFSLTLRRADNVPLGLNVRGQEGDCCLTVEAVRPGGAVEAWNRQCSGEARSIRPGDKVVAINSAEDAASMRVECLNKRLLKMTVQRGAGDEPACSLWPANPTGLRADANEFVPKKDASWWC